MRAFLFMLICPLIPLASVSADSPWPRHVVDDSLQGADGVRLADFDGDGQSDIVTGWEESGVIRLYLNPGPKRSKDPWPLVTIAESSSAEDAMPIDLDSDGRVDIVSCHEGSNRRVLVHWNRSDSASGNLHETRRSLLDSANWETQEIVPLQGQMWMFATPLKLASGQNALVVASKGSEASITLVVPPRERPRAVGESKIHRLRHAGWIMSLVTEDMDGDGDQDIVYSDRKGERRGVGWLEHPDQEATGADWHDHAVGGEDHEVMFLHADPSRVSVATRSGVWLDFSRTEESWAQRERPNPPNVTYGKAVKRLPKGHDSNESAGVILTANTRVVAEERDQPGVWWLPEEGPAEAIESPPGGKFDRIECLDLDGDGDADVLTCEERQNLGVIWYENPGY